MTAVEKIAKAIEPNAGHDDNGLTGIAAQAVVEAAKGLTDKLAVALAKGAAGALKGLPEDAEPLIVYQKTHQLRRLVELAKKSPAPPTPEPNDGPVE